METRALGAPLVAPPQLPPPTPSRVTLPPIPTPAELMAAQLAAMRVSIISGAPADAISPAVQKWEQQVVNLLLPL